jgi:hypothetical protein
MNKEIGDKKQMFCGKICIFATENEKTKLNQHLPL